MAKTYSIPPANKLANEKKTFVYLLRHATEARFKIGKANDIFSRIPSIGGVTSFNLEESLCVELASEFEAYRVEKLLHRLFNNWNLPVIEGGRCDGDTEQFDIDCFDRVLKFFADNQDLVGGVLPSPIQNYPQSGNTISKISKEERRKIKEDKVIKKEADAKEHLNIGIQIFKEKIIELLDMELDVFELLNGKNKTVLVKDSNQSKFQRAINIVSFLFFNDKTEISRGGCSFLQSSMHSGTELFLTIRDINFNDIKSKEYHSIANTQFNSILNMIPKSQQSEVIYEKEFDHFMEGIKRAMNG